LIFDISTDKNRRSNFFTRIIIENIKGMIGRSWLWSEKIKGINKKGRTRRSLCDKGQLEMLDDPVHHGIVCGEGNDAHLAAALGTEQRIDFKDFPYHFGPAAARDPRAFFLNDQELQRNFLRLTHFASMGIRIEAEITDNDLAFVWNMGSDPGDKLQVIHALHLFGSFPISVADLALFLRKGEALERKQQTAHEFSHALGLFPGLSPDLAVD